MESTTLDARMGRRIILRATPSAAGPFSSEAAWEIILATILTPREQPRIHFNISCFFSLRMPFGKLGAFFLTFRDPIFAPREHLGIPFCTSGAPWVAILVSR